jgi:hypothetical protein
VTSRKRLNCLEQMSFTAIVHPDPRWKRQSWIRRMDGKIDSSQCEQSQAATWKSGPCTRVPNNSTEKLFHSMSQLPSDENGRCPKMCQGIYQRKISSRPGLSGHSLSHGIISPFRSLYRSNRMRANLNDVCVFALVRCVVVTLAAY